MIDAIALAADSVKTVDELKEWTRKKIRPVFPHETLACGYGHLHAGGVALDYAVVIDYPIGHLQRIRNRAGGIDTPILRRWLATREPQLFEADQPWPDVPAAWLESFREHGLKNTAALGVYDTERYVATYHSFHRIPGRLGSAQIAGLYGLSENTVKHHLTNIFNKLAVKTRAQLVHRLDEYEAKAAPGFGTKIF